MNMHGLAAALAVAVAAATLTGCSEVGAIIEEEKNHNHSKACDDEVERVDPDTLAALNTVLRTDPDCAVLGMVATGDRVVSTTPEGEWFWTPDQIRDEILEKRRAPDRTTPPEPFDAPEPRSTPQQSCVYDPTYNDNWHDDMLCGGVRPYLLPDDDHITRDEIEAAARRWESEYDEPYEQYLRDYNDFLERERQSDEEYLSQFDEDGNCLNPNGCAVQRP